MTKLPLHSMIAALTTLLISTSVEAQRNIQETRQEIRQESRIESRTEARIANRHGTVNNKNNVVIIQNAMLRTVSYKGVVLLHDINNQRFYRAVDNGYALYSVPFGANVVELSAVTPTNITIIN